MSKNKKDELGFDPYELLGLQLGASDVDINKAYRKLALKLHPDKVEPSKRDESEEKFHQIKEARAFLQDTEKRQKFDRDYAARQRRRQQEEQREATISNRRKGLRDKLKRKEEEEEKSRRSKKPDKKRKGPDPNLMEQLRKDGKRRRQEYEDRQAEEELRRQRKTDKKQLENRQIRLKWSRKRISISPSEDSIAKLLHQFGLVESVEMIGSKGNAALVTFVASESCQPCVDHYLKSDEMRATHVNKEAASESSKQHETVDEPIASTKSLHDSESLQDRQLRQSLERERLLKEMQGDAAGDKRKRSLQPFPPEFPSTKELENLKTPLDRLQHFERVVFGKLITSDLMNQFSS